MKNVFDKRLLLPLLLCSNRYCSSRECKSNKQDGEEEDSVLGEMIDLSSVVAGSVAGAFGIFIGHPFDSLKVRVQVGAKVGEGGPGGIWNWHTLRQLYRGILPPLMTTGTVQAINFTLYERYKAMVHQACHGSARSPDQLYSLSTTFWSGTLSGSTISALTVPIGVVKIQQQVVSRHGVWRCIEDLYKRCGPRAFYRGFFCAFVMEAPGRGVYLWTYEFVKQRISQFVATATSAEDAVVDLATAYQRSPFYVSVISGATAGIVSWMVIYPFDVIKSRLQRDAQAEVFTSTSHCLKVTWAEGGLRALYRGIGYTLLRAGPVAASILPVYDLCKAYLDRELLVMEYQGYTE